MGRDKALLPFRGGILVEAIARQVAESTGSVTLVGHPDLGGIPDLYPREGPLGGIITALRHSSSDWNLIVACDLPGLSAEFLQRVVAAAMRTSAPIILPYGSDGRPEPLCAAYHRRSQPHLEAAFSRGIRKITAAMDGLAPERLDVEEVAVFQNVNTPEDWSRYVAE
jgi:molybdopterin-guanine dinucleotide biosynthesis protein A